MLSLALTISWTKYSNSTFFIYLCFLVNWFYSETEEKCCCSHKNTWTSEISTNYLGLMTTTRWRSEDILSDFCECFSKILKNNTYFTIQNQSQCNWIAAWYFPPRRVHVLPFGIHFYTIENIEWLNCNKWYFIIPTETTGKRTCQLERHRNFELRLGS